MEMDCAAFKTAWLTIKSTVESLLIALGDLLTINTLTGLLVIITGFYAWTTFKMLKSNHEVIEIMKGQNESATRPHIVVQIKLKPELPLLFLCIKNHGKTSALDLELTLHQPFYRLDQEQNIQDFKAFSQVIQSFPPETELEFILIEGHKLYNNPDPSRTPLNFDISAKYNYQGKTVEEIHHVDLTPYGTMTIFKEKPTEALEAISRSLTEIASEVVAVRKVVEKIGVDPANENLHR